MTRKQELPQADEYHEFYPLEWLAKAIDSARRIERSAGLRDPATPEVTNESSSARTLAED